MKKLASHSVSTRPTLVFSLTALILYIPANIFPFMTLELYGNKNTSTIWSGINSLVDVGSWPIALIIFLASMVIPLFKLIALFYLALSSHNEDNLQLRLKLHAIIESIGRWSMLDIFLLAIMVSILKFGKWTTVTAEVGSYLFALVVIFTMLASASYNPHISGADDAHED